MSPDQKSLSKNLLGQLTETNLYARYSGILTLSEVSLSLVDAEGKVVHEFIPSPDFCTHVCRRSPGTLCEGYQSRFARGETGRFVCRHGLSNMILPITANGSVIGYIVGLHVFSPENEYLKYMIDVQNLGDDTSLDAEFVAKAIASLKTLENEKIDIHEQIGRHIARNISMDLSESAGHAKSDLARLSVEKDILEKKIIELEAKNMSLVINPHFLFNTLNCIARIAYFENSHQTEDLIYCLSDLLRYNLKQDDKLHTLGSEIDNIQKYLHIQKARFKNRLEYEIDVPANILSCRIPNMVIQPIVENALIHGITPKRDGGRIDIKAYEDGEDLIVVVSDNGNGFPKEVLERLKDSGNKPGLGFSTTDNRLRSYYGEPYGLTIDKSDFSGSTISIRIPTQVMGR